MGIYSKSAEAGKKHAIDDDIAKQKIPIDMHDETYLKALIAACSKGGATVVAAKAKGLQFFIIKGGAEGFLDNSYSGKDASRIVIGAAATTSGGGVSMVFDENDLIVAFDKSGKLVSVARLQRPLSILNAPSVKWTEKTANHIYDAWDGRPVSIYRNANFDVTYYGLKVDDKLGWYRRGKVRVDMHKQEATNGCIFIVDSNTPAYSDSDNTALNMFEPQFILDIQKAVGAKVKTDIGIMHMLDVNSKS